jgi:hypothetical protein
MMILAKVQAREFISIDWKQMDKFKAGKLYYWNSMENEPDHFTVQYFSFFS